VVTPKHQRVLVRIEALIDTDDSFFKPDRPVHVSKRKQGLHVLEFQRQLELELGDLFQRDRCRDLAFELEFVLIENEAIRSRRWLIERSEKERLVMA